MTACACSNCTRATTGSCRKNCADLGKLAVLQQADGFAGLKAVLPPAPRRGLILIDPPFEDKRDYQTVIKALQESLRRFATGIYAIWYPHLQRQEVAELTENLKKLPCRGWLHAGLDVQTPSPDGFGMHGSSMFILNPPWTLNQDLQILLPWLVTALGRDKGAGYILASHENAG